MVLYLNVPLASNKDWGRDRQVADTETFDDMTLAM